MSDDDSPLDNARPRRSKKLKAATYKANDEGGYGNPPVTGQFKPGGKGGPGRPPGPQGLTARMRKMLNGTVTDKNGNTALMEDAFIQTVRRQMLTNGVRGVELGLKVYDQFGSEPPPTPVEPQPRRKRNLSSLSAIELELYIMIAARLERKEPPSEFEWSQLLPGHYIVYPDERGLPVLERVEDAAQPRLSGP